MIDFPREPASRESLDAAWGIRVVRALRALFPSGGPGVRVATGPGGTTISADPATAPAARPAGAVPAVVTGFSAGVYTVDLYGDGLLRRKTGTARLALTEAQPLAPLPAGTVLLAHETAAAAAASGTDTGEEE